MTVHQITAKSQSGSDILADRDNLGREIVSLSRQFNETVAFHGFQNDMIGGTVILLECSDAFLGAVKNLPGVDKISAPGHATEKKDSILRWFS